MQEFEAEMEAQQDQQNAPPSPSQAPNAGTNPDQPGEQDQPDAQDSEAGNAGVRYQKPHGVLDWSGSTGCLCVYALGGRKGGGRGGIEI